MRSRIRSSFALRLLAAGVALSLVLIVGISAFLLISRQQQTRTAAVTNSGNRATVFGHIFENVAKPDLVFQAKSIAADDEAGQKRIASLKRELLLREIEIYSSRTDRYPNDARYKHELGKRYMLIKEYRKAIPLLQQATVDQRRAPSVQVLLAKCFLAEKQPKLARTNLERACEKLNPHDEAETYCEAHYILARLCEESGDRDEAEHHYGLLLSVDYSYKDARERHEKLQSGEKASD